MELNRRDLSRMLPALFAAAAATAQEKEVPAPESKVYHEDKIPYIYEGDDKKKKGRRFLYGTAHRNYRFEMHETVLEPGKSTHEPHKHPAEVIVLVAEGTVEAYFDGRTEIAKAGSVIFWGSNVMHSMVNVGSTPTRYYVFEMRGQED